jgi:sigma-B regulation protein RsbU (phosphoserine phosphatase)
MVLIDANMPEMNGFVVCSLMRDLGGKSEQIPIYMISADDNRNFVQKSYEVGFDRCFHKPIDPIHFIGYIRKVFERKNIMSEMFAAIEKARKDQEKMLPKPIVRENFLVEHLYCPYKKLSGDFVDYWLANNEMGLCGYIFDVAGHDIASAMQVNEFRTLFRHGFNTCEEVDQVMNYVNKEMIDLHEQLDDPLLVAAVAFQFNFLTKQMSFCSAAIPCFFIVHDGKYNEIPMSGPLLGYKKTATFTKKNLRFDNMDEVIFSSDGFAELLSKNSVLKDEKHDDASAIMICLKKESEEWKLC